MGEDGEVYHRDNIFEFFRNHTAYDMLPESGKVCYSRYAVHTVCLLASCNIVCCGGSGKR